MKPSAVILLMVITILKVRQSSAGKIWHVSDFHYDPKLVELKRSCVQAVTDVGEWGTEYCDANMKLINSSLDAMRRIEPDPLAIVWSGDTALHYLTVNGTVEEVTDIKEQMSRALHSRFPNTPVVVSLGNHDYVPDNQLPASANKIYKNISNVWQELGWFDDEHNGKQTFENYGYYAITVSAGLKAVALNTNYYYLGNQVFKSQQIPDPGNQFSFLEELLENATQKSEKVIVSAHVPFGVGAQGRYIHMYDKYNAKLIALMRKYHDVIVGPFFGHEHDDSFKLLSDSDGTPVLVAYLAPSVTPWRYIAPGIVSPYHNPAITLIDYDQRAHVLKERIQYSFDLRSANKGEDTQWVENYNFTSLYGVPDASVSSANKAAQSIASGKKFDDYLKQYYAKLVIDDFTCNDTCRKGMSCAVLAVELDKVTECLETDSPNTAKTITPQLITLLILSTSIRLVLQSLQEW